MAEGIERKNSLETLRSIVKEVQRVFEERQIDCSDVLINTTTDTQSVVFGIPQALDAELAAVLNDIGRKSEYVDFALDLEPDDQNFFLKVSHNPGRQTQEPDVQRLLRQTHFEDVPARVRQVFDNFVLCLDADMVSYEKADAANASELAIHITSSFFKYETFLRLLSQINHPGVTIAHDPDEQIITFSQLLD